MTGRSRKKHPRWSYEDHGPSSIEEAFPGVTEFQEIEQFQVLAWSPGAPGSKATQVHIAFQIKGTPEARLFFRLKTVDAMDAFLRLLAEYRRHVWGTK